jgi:hypothetical protein
MEQVKALKHSCTFRATCFIFTKLHFAHKVYLVVLHMIVRINISFFPEQP